MKENITEIKEIEKHIFLPDWNTNAYFCKDGSIYVQLIQGRYFTKDSWKAEIRGQEHTRAFINNRVELFNELERYFLKYR